MYTMYDVDDLISIAIRHSRDSYEVDVESLTFYCSRMAKYFQKCGEESDAHL